MALDLSAIAEGTTAITAALDLFRSADATARDVAASLPSGAKREAAERALEKADQAALIARASVAKALGYELCRCKFPPEPMLYAGYRSDDASPVYECPVCSRDSATPYSFTRA